MGSEKTYCCHLCGRLFSTLSGFTGHQNKHAAMLEPSVVCDLRLGRQQMKHWKANLCRYHCVLCGFTTRNGHYLKSHLKCHLGKKPYSCHICGKNFEWKGYLKVHINTVHENMRPYSCETCGKQFKQRASLTAHSKSQHNGEKPFLCCECPKSFARVSSLRYHMKRHLLGKKAKKEYCCHLCDNRPFLDKTCLTVHMASAHSNTKSYTCEVCGRGFKLNNCLRAHMQTHSEERPYYCQLCDGAFKSKKDLNKHQERHKSSRDHVCETCGKCFVTRNDVYLHQKVHDPSKKHRIYKPGKYKVSQGELLTARTRSNKLALKEQEPISFDTEINAAADGCKLKKVSKVMGSNAVLGGALTGGANTGLTPSHAAVSSDSLSFEALLETSNSSSEFHGFHTLERTRHPRDSVDQFLSNSSQSTTCHSAQPAGCQLERSDRWNSEELLEDYDWLDASSPADGSVAKSSNPLQDSMSEERGCHPGGGHGEVRLLDHDDHQIMNYTSSLHQLSHFGDQENNSDLHLQSLNEYLNGELDNSQSLTQVNLDDFNSSLHSTQNRSHDSDSSLHSTQNRSHDSDSQSLAQVDVDDFTSSQGTKDKLKSRKVVRYSQQADVRTLKVSCFGNVDPSGRDSQQAGVRKVSCFKNVGPSGRDELDYMLDNDDVRFFGLADPQLPNNGRNILLRSDHHVESAASSKPSHGINRGRRIFIDFQMTSCDMFSDTSDISKENFELHVRPDGIVPHNTKNRGNALSFGSIVHSFRNHCLTRVETDNHLTEVETEDHLSGVETGYPLSEVEDHLTGVETEGHLTEVEDHLTEVEDHLTEENTEDHLTGVETEDNLTVLETEDHLTEKNTEDHLTEEETEDHLAKIETEDQLAHIETENHLTEVETEDHLTEVETEDHLTEVETEDHLTEVETEDHLTEVETEDHLTEVETEDHLTEVETEDHLTEVETENHLTEVETEDHLTEVETQDHLADIALENMNGSEIEDDLRKEETQGPNQTEKNVEGQHGLVKQNNMRTPEEKHWKKYKLVELVSEAEELSHGIMRGRKQRKVAAACCRCSTCAAALTSSSQRQPCKISSSPLPTRFPCGDCGRDYTTRSNLKIHWACSHAEDRQVFVCHLCGHVCNDRQNLGSHLLLHSNARPFKCDLCQKGFKTRVAIKVHLNKHLPGRMLFRCELCPLAYNHFNSLQAHKKTHLADAPLFTCSICGRRLSDKSNLAAHLRRHLLVSKYPCPVCSKELSSAHSLQGHQGGKACLKHQLKTLKAKEKAQRCLLRKRTKEKALISYN